MSEKKVKGKQGENIALDYLTSKGIRVRHTNFFSRYGEIDIVGETLKGEILFIEVKHYKPHSLVHPLEAITLKKRSRIKTTARHYLMEHSLFKAECRFDVMIIDQGSVTLHLENAFQ